jgi:hypothetical protein
MRRTACLLAMASGCAANGAAPGVVETAPVSSAPVLETAPRAAVSAAGPATPVPSIGEGSPPLDLPTVQALRVPVSSIALGDGSRIAVLADPPYVGDARGIHPVPLPAALRAKSAEADELRIFFGRDNEPRVMGTRRSATGEAPVYWRHTNAGWRDGREEIGQLGSTSRGGLWGVLGSADPELVCRTNAVCIIKRTSGWTTAPAGSTTRVVELRGGTLWGLDASGLAKIDVHGWSVAIAAPAWSEPQAFWTVENEAWVATTSELFHYVSGAWSKEEAVITAPTAFWGLRPDSVWVVGKGGAAHFDGHGWRRLSLPGPLGAVIGRSDTDLWFGGDAGLFRAQP